MDVIKTLKFTVLLLVVFAVGFSLVPLNKIPKVYAAPFQMQTGYYGGDGVSGKQITNLGFTPDVVFLKDDSAVGDDGFLWKSSAMTGGITAKLAEAEGDVAVERILSLDTTGFTIGNNDDVNTANEGYFWFAFGGSDCTVTGSLCVGLYTGDGGAQNISTGFDPDLVIVKASTNRLGVWKTSEMPANQTNFFSATTGNTAGQMLQSLGSGGFGVGNDLNVNGNGINYWFVAFRQLPGVLTVGSYTGNNTDNRNIDSSINANLNYRPDLVFLKNSDRSSVSYFRTNQHYGDRALRANDATSLNNSIQAFLDTGGFQIGTRNEVNANNQTIVYVSFGGAPPPSSSGTYTMANGTYVGNGATNSITGVGFQPDLVIIRSLTTDQQVVFKTRMMGTFTAYMGTSTTHFANGITSLANDGFNLGNSAVVNANGVTYSWQAFGNAWNPETNSGASDFMVGQYLGTGEDDHNINRLPFQSDLVVIKRRGNTNPAWRASNMPSDTTQFFTNAAQVANHIQEINSDGFQLGTGLNIVNNYYDYFAFKVGPNFRIGSYTGTGADQDITSGGITPDFVFTKKASGGAGRIAIYRSSVQSGNAGQRFTDSAAVANSFTDLIPGGFSIGDSVDTNENGFLYYFASWRLPPTGPLEVTIVDDTGNPVASPTLDFNTIETGFTCQTVNATLGTTTQKIRVTNNSANPNWVLNLAALLGNTAVWESLLLHKYDYNDPAGSPAGCSDGGDTDNLAGQMSINLANVVISPSPTPGCTTNGVNIGSSSSFNENVVDSISLVNASAAADVLCYWDITGIEVTQIIPAEQKAGSYTLQMDLNAVSI